MGHNRLSIFSCGGASAASCIPPAPRAAGNNAPPPIPSSAAKLDAKLAPLSPRRRAEFKSELDNWVKFAKKGKDGEPTENRTEAAERIATAEITQARQLDVSALKIRRLPARIDKVQTLVKLDASNNELQRVPKEIGDLRRLQCLDLSGNELTELPTSIGRLGRLTTLNVSCNHLWGLPDELEGLSNLRSLDAHQNQLSQVPASMGKLSKLREINLHKNRIWELPDAWNSLFKRLRQLDLSDNALQELPDAFRPGIETIEIRLQNNPIRTLPTSFRGFQPSSWFSEHELRNRAGTVVVHTENTGLRAGLAQDGRLFGIDEVELPLRAHERPPAPGQFEPDIGSVYSVLDYIREHGEPGQIEGIADVKLSAPQASFGAQLSSGPPDWTKPKPDTDAWLAEQAQIYANRHGAAPPAPPQPPQPQPVMADWADWKHTGLPASAAIQSRTAPPRFNFQLGPQAEQPPTHPASQTAMLPTEHRMPGSADINLIVQIAAQVLQARQPMPTPSPAPAQPTMRPPVTRESPLAESSPFVSGMSAAPGQSSPATPPWGASPFARAGTSAAASGARVPPTWVASTKAAEQQEEEQSIDESYQWGESYYGDTYSHQGYPSYNSGGHATNPPAYPVNYGNVQGYDAQRYDEPPPEEPKDFLTQIEEAMTRWMS